MVNSVLGDNVSVLLSAFMREAAARQAVEVSMVKKAQDVEKMQGEAALKLIESAGSALQESKIDVYV